MASIYEYLFTGIIIVLILTASISVISALSYPSTSQYSKQQLQTTAEKIMNQLLLDPGNPIYWGTTTSVPDIFGLAKSGETSRQAYSLDPDKLMRLKTDSPSHISPQLASSLLNLGRDYGFTLEIRNPLNISSTNMGDNTFEIKVENLNGLPIKNAQITSTLYYLNSISDEILYFGPNSALTSSNGICEITFEGLTQNNAILIVVVDYYGATVFEAYPFGEVMLKSIHNQEIVPFNSYYITNNLVTLVYSVKQDNNNIFDYTLYNYNQNNNEFKLPCEPEESMIAIIAASNDQLLLATRNFTMEGSNSYSTLTNPIQNFAYSPLSYSLERTVHICSNTYVVTLYIWRLNT